MPKSNRPGNGRPAGPVVKRIKSRAEKVELAHDENEQSIVQNMMTDPYWSWRFMRINSGR